MLVLMVLVLAGCGANVSTSMTIDENFAGKRDITLTLDSSDVSEITGGITGIGSTQVNVLIKVEYVDAADETQSKIYSDKLWLANQGNQYVIVEY